MPSALPIGELFILGFKGFTVPKWLRLFAERFGLGGIILFDYDVGTGRYERNVRDSGQVQSLCGEIAGLASIPLIFVDQEGGRVRQSGFSPAFSPIRGHPGGIVVGVPVWFRKRRTIGSP